MRVPTRVVLLLVGLVSTSSIFIAALKAVPAQAPRSSNVGGQTAAAPQPTIDAAREQQLFQQYCYGCHNERVKAVGLDSAKKLTLDTLDTANVHRDAKTW